jgi:hypothetical protein
MANEGEFSFREWPGGSLEQLKEGLTTRARKALDKSEIPSLPALVNHTERQALAAKGIGRKSLAELRTALGAIRLQFGMSVVSFAGGPLDGQRLIFEDELPEEYRLPVGPPEREQAVVYRLDRNHSEPIYKA